MSSPTSDNVELIKQMGLTDEVTIRNVLRQTSNDVDAAIQILFPDTEEQSEAPPPGIESQSGFERIDSYDIEMKVGFVQCLVECNLIPVTTQICILLRQFCNVSYLYKVPVYTLFHTEQETVYSRANVMVVCVTAHTTSDIGIYGYMCAYYG